MKHLIKTLLILLISVSSFAQLEWESKASIPQFGKYGAVSFSVGNEFYVCTGLQQDGAYSKQLWSYNLNSGVWTKKSDYPGSGGYHGSAFVIGNKAYVGLGGDASGRYKDFYEYNPATNTWTQKANFPGASRFTSVSFSIGGTGYFGLGGCGGTTCYYNDLWAYNPTTNTWTQKANWPGGGAVSATAFVLNGEAYAGCYRNSSSARSNQFYKYNPVSNSWSSIATMPGTAVEGAIAFTLNNEGYVGTGTTTHTTSFTLTNNFYKYNATSNSWASLTSNSQFIPRFEGIVSTIQDSIVLAGAGLGGTGLSDVGILSGLWELDLNSNYYDTTFVQDTTFINDTTFVQDPTFVQDTTYITIYDTSYITVQDTLTFNINTASVNQPQLVGMKVYPNPAGSVLTIAIADFTQMSSYTLKMYNTLGSEVYSQSVTSATHTINTSTLGGAGTYYLEIYDSLNAKRSRKVIIIQ